MPANLADVQQIQSFFIFDSSTAEALEVTLCGTPQHPCATVQTYQRYLYRGYTWRTSLYRPSYRLLVVVCGGLRKHSLGLQDDGYVVLMACN